MNPTRRYSGASAAPSPHDQVGEITAAEPLMEPVETSELPTHAAELFVALLPPDELAARDRWTAGPRPGSRA